MKTTAYLSCLAVLAFAAFAGDAPAPAKLDTFALKASADTASTEISLGGTWEGTLWLEPEVWAHKPLPNRTEFIKELPKGDEVKWSPVTVPGNRPTGKGEHIDNAHRLLYRTKVSVPAELAGHAFVLRLPSFNMIASAIVNGVFCGGAKTPFAIWDCDITKAVKPGAENEIVVAVKDQWYGLSNADQDAFAFTIPISLFEGHNQGIGMVMDFPVFTRLEAGILETPRLSARGPVYTSDVFAIPSVKNKQLSLEITVFNPGAAEAKVTVENEIVPLEGGAAEKKFAASQVAVGAGATVATRLAEPWEKPKLWWPDEPNQYEVVTKLSVGGKVVDVKRTKFGFREWEWNALEFKLNGVPWNGRADLCYAASPEDTLRVMKSHGQTMFRFWGSAWAGLDQQATLDFMDKSGMPVRRSGVFDGEFASYNWWERNPALFDNWREIMKAQVRGERNHPSIFIWSLENEITFINSRNLGKLNSSDPAVKRTAQEVMALDPTRPVMVDGGNCLLDNSLPVNGCHYIEALWRDLPDAAYSLDFMYASKTPWEVVRNRPILLGETYFAMGASPADYAEVGGEVAFRGRGDAKAAVGLIAKMYAEGYRWAHVNPHFWGYDGEMPFHHTTWQPVAVLVREWDHVFNGGAGVKRTCRVFNDTHSAAPIEMAWQARLGEKTVAQGKQTFNVAPGLAQDTEIAFTVPAVTERTAGQLVLTCARDGKEVFRDIKPLTFLAPESAPKPNFKGAALTVLDPNGAVKARLQKRGIAFTEAMSFNDLTDKAKFIIIGKDALSANDAGDPKLLTLAGAGARILVLDQAHPLAGKAAPGAEVSQFAGRMAFAQFISHPIFAGLAQEDLSLWSRGHIVYRNVYKKPPSGAAALVQCDQQLGCTAVAACPANEGLLLLSQMAVGEKLASDAVAQRLFDNMLNYLASYQLVQRNAAVVMDEKTPQARLVANLGMKSEKAPDVLSAIAGGKYGVIVADATPETLKSLAGAPDKLKAFTAKGGWLMLWGLDPKGLADFNKLIGVEHLLRPFEMERVTMPAVRDGLLAGLTSRDVTMEGAGMYEFAADKFMAGNVFTYVVDNDDIAPFCEFPDPIKYFKMENPKPGEDHWPRNMVNGFTSNDSWKYVFSINFEKKQPTKFTLTLPREEEITDFQVIFNAFYHKVTKFKLSFNGDDDAALAFDVTPDNDRHEFAITPARKAKTITVDIAEWTQAGTAPVVGVDNLWIKIKRSDEFYKKVVPLLNIGALVKYPMGDGGVVLNELRITDDTKSPNAQKKQNIAAMLLRNMGAVFQAK